MANVAVIVVVAVISTLLAASAIIALALGLGLGIGLKNNKIECKYPTITSISPNEICLNSITPNGMVSVQVIGKNFLKVKGILPKVRFENVELNTTQFSNCSPVPNDNTLEECTKLTFEIHNSQFILWGDGTNHKLVIVNPSPYEECGTVAESYLSDTLQILKTTTVNYTSPGHLCAALGQQSTITIHGSGYTSNSKAYIEKNGVVTAALSTLYIDNSTVVAVFSSEIESGTYTIHVSNSNNTAPCFDVSGKTIIVYPLVIVLFTNPPTIYNDVNVQMTVYTNGFSESPKSVVLTQGNSVQPLDYTTSNGDFSKVITTIPKGLNTGTWSVSVTSVYGCVARLDNFLNVTNQLSINLNAIDPPNAYFNESTGVTIQSLSTGSPFIQSPIVYLNPVNSNSNSLAFSLKAVVRENANTLTAVIPSGLPVGKYDLIVVNMEGSVGILKAGVSITNVTSPIVYAVTPDTVSDSSTPTAATIHGINFIPGAMTVYASCSYQGSVLAKRIQTVTASTANALSVSFDIKSAAKYADGSICLIEVVNSNTGQSFRYSAVTIRSSSSNIPPFTSLFSELNIGRRKLALVKGNPTPSSRYLYAIAGDNGADNQALPSIEKAGITLYGNLGSWEIGRYPLPVNLTSMSAVTISRYVYVFGGKAINSTNSQVYVSNAVYRAQMLDPLATPTVDISVSIAADRKSNITAGLWYYKVSALFDANSTTNPNGESLPSDPVTITLPDVKGIIISLNWDKVPNAVGYKVYRTLQSNNPISSLVHIATVYQNSYADKGNDLASLTSPLSPGSLGNWYKLPYSLNTGREGLSATAVPAVNNTIEELTTNWHMYAISGRDSNGNYLTNYEYINITIIPPTSPKTYEEHILSGWTIGKKVILPKAETTSTAVSNTDFKHITSGRHWIYIGPGRNTPSSLSNTLQASQVGLDGDLENVLNVDGSPTLNYAGSFFKQGSGYMYLLGGKSGIADSGIYSGQFCDFSGKCASLPTPPALQGFNSNGGGFVVPRIYHACEITSGNWFCFGGATDTATATTKGEITPK
ncbi:hypothetical protein ABK040_013131 [Willaertia magna]